MSEEQHRLALSQGTRIRDFEFHRVLGHGGFGITYLGWNLSLDIPVAIKEYLPTDWATREQDLSVVPQASQVASDFQWGLERFLDEARTLARFQHPNIVRVHQYFEAHGTAYIAMDYVEGEDLSAYLTRKGTLSEDELKSILYPLLDALEVIHRADFLHRDIKPGNIVIRDTDGSPVLLDFGSARQAIEAKSRPITSIVTPGYAPIEQYSSQVRQGPWTDIYALGGVCYRALTGQVPYSATDRIRDDPLTPLAQRYAGRVSGAFLSAIDWALTVDDRDRPQSVAAWRAAMVGDARHGEIRRGQASLRKRVQRWWTRTRAREKHDARRETARESRSSQAAPKVDQARRLDRWFKLHCICLAAIIPVSTALFVGVAVALAAAKDGRMLKELSRELASLGLDVSSAVLGMFGIIVAIVAVIFGLIALISGLRILHKLWSLIPADKARTTPGKAVGFLFIPLFSLYWTFVAFYCLARALNAETGRKSVSEAVSFIYCCSFWVYLVDLLWAVTGGREHMELAEFLWAIVIGREDQAWIVSIGFVVGFVLWFVMLKQMKNAGMFILRTAEAQKSQQ